mgnify:CR=1 FL=1
MLQNVRLSQQSSNAAITAKGTVYVMIGSDTAPSDTPSGAKVADYEAAYIISQSAVQHIR